MPFPTSGVLDDANRANVGPPPSANWTTALLTVDGANGHKVLTNRIVGNGIDAQSYWNAADYGPDCEVYADVATQSDDMYLFLRLVSIGSGTTDGYALELKLTDSWQLQRVDNGALTGIGLAVVSAVANGDAIGFEVIGSTLKGYKRVSGVWSEVLSRTDSTYSAAGKLGIGTVATATALDDFGGGTIVTAPVFGPFVYRTHPKQKLAEAAVL